MLRQRARNPPRSRPRKCAISSSTDVLVEARPLRPFFCIASGRLFGSVRSGGWCFAGPNSIDPALVRLLRDKVESELLADHTGKKAAHGMLLPLSCGDERRNRRASTWYKHPTDKVV